jgi:hypothetical protein
MSELIAFPLPKAPPESLETLVERTHALAKKSENVFLDHPHTKQRMRERKVTIRQILDVLRQGKGIDGPTLDKHGDWRIKLKRFSAGRTVQVVVVVKDSYLEVVTVI